MSSIEIKIFYLQVETDIFSLTSFNYFSDLKDYYYYL